MQNNAIQMLSVRQPHTDQIIFGDKWCENRASNSKSRGPLYVHAFKRHSSGDRNSEAYFFFLQR